VEVQRRERRAQPRGIVGDESALSLAAAPLDERSLEFL
jgi:hypothetical protein